MKLLQLRTTLKLSIWEANSEAFTLPVFFPVQNMSTDNSLLSEKRQLLLIRSG